MSLGRAAGTVWIAVAGRRNPRTGEILRGGKAVAVDAETGRVERVLSLPVDPTELAVAFGSLWVIGSPTERRYTGVLRVDPRSGRVLSVIRASHAYGSRIGATADAVWVGGADVYAKGHSDRAGVRYVYKIDPKRNLVMRRVRLPQGMTVLHFEGEQSSLWVSGWWGVAKLSSTGRVLFHEAFSGAGWSMARAARAVWVVLPWTGTPYDRRQDASHAARRLLRIDTGGGSPRATVIDLEQQPGGVAALGDTVWLAGSTGLARVDDHATPPAIVPVAVDVHPTDMEPFAGGVWVAEFRKHRLVKIVC